MITMNLPLNVANIHVFSFALLHINTHIYIFIYVHIEFDIQNINQLRVHVLTQSFAKIHSSHATSKLTKQKNQVQYIK